MQIKARIRSSFVSPRVALSLLLSSSLFLPFGVVAQAPKRAAQKPQIERREDRIERPVSEPYRGDLSIFEDANRERNLQIDRVMEILGVASGKSVADIGAGSGWFTTRAARKVGARGQVFAVEINPEFIKHINERARVEKLANIRTILGREDDPMLPARSVDAALILKTYHEIAEPVRVLKALRTSLRAGARLGVIDRNGAGDDHGINRDRVVDEAKRAGYKLVAEHDFVKPDGMDYFLVFEVAG